MTRRGPGEGSLYQRQDGRWAGSVHIGYEGGRRIRKHVLGHSRAEVKEKLASIQRLQAEQRPIPDLRIKAGALSAPVARRGGHDRGSVRRPSRATGRSSRGTWSRGSGISPWPSSPRPRSRRSSTASRRRACRLAGSSTSTPSCAERSVTAERWGLVEPQRGQARRPTAGPPPRDHAADTGAGPSAHRDLHRGPLPGALDHGARHGAAAGRAPRPALGGCRPQGRAPVGPPHAGERGWHADPARAQDRPQPTARHPARGRPCRAPGPPHPPEAGPPRGGLTLDRQRSRLRDDAGQAASRRDHHAGPSTRPSLAPSSPTPASTTCATRQRRSSCPRASVWRTSRTS